MSDGDTEGDDESAFEPEVADWRAILANLQEAHRQGLAPVAVVVRDPSTRWVAVAFSET